ncbi:hypothetical protein [Chitinophaga sp. S165]|uniref:hypothetical protein n=1 Tax=Chitinophaga sp. S165 TaxID=2135462 RepID=UPI0011B451F2|nr:hypothetical protein [Chitinophaga sp. S165]
MRSAILFLAVCLLSCRQPSSIDKQAKDTIPVGTTVDDFTAAKASLENDFLLNKDSAEYSSQDLQTAIVIGHLFERETKDAVLRYSENDSVARLVVLREKGKNWDTIISERLYPASTGDWSDLIEVSDFNGDNIPDLKVVKEHWDFHTGENADLWLYSNGHFTKVKGFDQIVSATYDKPTDLIYAYQSMGCADMAMYFGVFKVVGDTVQTVKEMSCDCCSESGDSCKIKVYGQEPFMVPAQKAYKYVPDMYAEGVKEKCAMVGRK